MYFPYFRGKQYELVTVRESAGLFAKSHFVPIVEPVKEAMDGLKRAMGALKEAAADGVLILNPQCGDIAPHGDVMESFFAKELGNTPNVSAGIILTDQMTTDAAIKICGKHSDRLVTLVHAGFTQPKPLADRLAELQMNVRNVFLETASGKLYQKHFKGSQRILLRDGFQRRVNRGHPPVEFFSDLHVTYDLENMDGFGDFLIVGDDFSETGGPAYAVAIHLTFIDSDQDDQMFVHHFVSDRTDTPTDPAGKFGEALTKLVSEVKRPQTHIAKTEAVAEFLELHSRSHFPGLGYVKKLSMKHHIQTLARYFSQ
jgi:hypothetical protein